MRTDRLAGVKFLGLHRVAEYLEQEQGIQIEEIPVPPHSGPVSMVVTLDAFLAGREKTTLAEILKNVTDVPPEKDLPDILKNLGWESRRTAIGRFWVKAKG